MLFYQGTVGKKVYKVRRLVDGSEVGQEPGSTWVAVPEMTGTVVVKYGHQRMTIKDWRKNAEFFRLQRDKFYTPTNGRREHFLLGYFPFNADV